MGFIAAGENVALRVEFNGIGKELGIGGMANGYENPFEG
jgi:hypothetical protein